MSLIDPLALCIAIPICIGGCELLSGRDRSQVATFVRGPDGPIFTIDPRAAID